MKNVSVLIAEDDAELRKVLHLVLEGEGFEVMTAENGAIALWILGHYHPDVILTDLTMPQVDGIDLIHGVKSKAELANIPIVVMSDYGSDRLEEAAREGAAATMEKPFGIQSLVEMINHVLPRPDTMMH